jgi:excisionase family DNA binding protein
MKRPLMTSKEVAALYGIHPESVRRWARGGRLPFLKIIRELRFDAVEVESFLERRKVGFLFDCPPPLLLGLSEFDKLHLKGGKSALGKNPRCWRYRIGRVFLRKTKRGDRWCIDYRDREGRRKREVVKGAQNRGEAVAALQKKVAGIFDQAYHPKRNLEPVTFGEFADKYIEDYAKPKKRSWRTDKGYIEKSMKKFFRGRLLSEINPLDLERFIKARLKEGVTQTTVNRGLQILRRMFNLAIDWGFAAENPMRKVRLFSEKNNLKERILARDEETRLLESSSEHLKPIIITALNSGLRRNEILGLRWTDVDFKGRTIQVKRSKGGGPGCVDMNSALYELLKDLRLSTPAAEFVFWNPKTGKPFVEIGKAFRAACRRAKIHGLRFHDLRHTFASRLIEAGVDIITVRDLLGHSSVKLTERYCHSKSEQKRRAVELLMEKRPEKVAQIWHKSETAKGRSPAISLFSVN